MKQCPFFASIYMISMIINDVAIILGEDTQFCIGEHCQWWWKCKEPEHICKCEIDRDIGDYEGG